MERVVAKSILHSGKKGSEQWFGTDYIINLYRGCNHGCIYCDSRSNCYGIDDFDTVKLKKDCIPILARELKSKKKTGVIGIGAMSDPYNLLERDMAETRQALTLIRDFDFGVGIATKSSLVCRDLPTLLEIKRKNPVIVKVTITTCDEDRAKALEPRACPPQKRFETIRELARNGIFTGVLLMPVLPFITDAEENVRAIVQRAHESGAKFIYPMFGVTLRENQREYFLDRVDAIEPGMKDRYVETFGGSYYCKSPRHKELKRMFERECKDRGLLFKMPDIIKAYKEPYEFDQLAFDL